MAFLTLSDGSTTIDLDVEVDSFREAEPESIGSTSRAFDGSFRGDKETFRVFSFVAVNLSATEFEALRALIANDAPVQLYGDALGGMTLVGIAAIGDAPFIDDANRAEGFGRTVAITWREG